MGEKMGYCKPTFMNIPQEKREKILSVAVNEFAYNGFENANINTIAKKAEVSVGSLYKYFDTKTDLFMTSVHYGVSNLEVIVESVSRFTDKGVCKVTYAVCDSDNHIAKATRKIIYTDYVSPTFFSYGQPLLFTL